MPCGICNDTVQPTDKSSATCGVCKTVFHLKCLKLDNSDFSTEATPSTKWRCGKCSKRKLSTDSITATSGARLLRSNSNSGSIIETLEAFRKTFEEKITLMTDTNNSTNKLLNNAMTLINELKSENTSLKERISHLEHHAREQDRVSELTSLEVFDFPSEIEDDIYKNASEVLSSALNMDIPQSAISDSFIIKPSKGKKKQTQKNGQTGPNIWVIRLTTMRMREMILSHVKANGRNANWKFSGITTKGTECAIQIRERVSGFAREMFRETKRAASTNGWKYVWMKAGRVHVRVVDKGRVFFVNSPLDIQRIKNEVSQ